MGRPDRTMDRIHSPHRLHLALTAGTAALWAHFLAALLNGWAAAASLEPAGSGNQGASVIGLRTPEFAVRMGARAEAPALADSLGLAPGARTSPEDRFGTRRLSEARCED